MDEKVLADSLKDLGARIDQTRKPKRGAQESGVAPAEGEPAAGRGSLVAAAFRIGVELVVAVGLCAGAGLMLDRWLDSWPLAAIIGFFLGVGAGFRNVYRAGEQISR